MQSSQYQSLHKDKVEYEISGLSGIYTLLFSGICRFRLQIECFSSYSPPLDFQILCSVFLL